MFRFSCDFTEGDGLRREGGGEGGRNRLSLVLDAEKEEGGALSGAYENMRGEVWDSPGGAASVDAIDDGGGGGDRNPPVTT